jgi:hypothetical protein
MHPKDNEVYPIDTVVRWKKTGQFAIIRRQNFIMDNRGFLHYLGVIEGRGDALYCLIHDDLELKALPV